MRILITGATGFVGQHLVVALSKENHQLWAIVRKSSDKVRISKLKKLGVKLIVSDLKNLKAIKLPSVDGVIHLAALVDPTDQHPYEELLAENTQPTIKLAEHYQGKIQKFIFLSSMAAIGTRNSPLPITEKTATNPLSKYGKSKLAAEKHLLNMYLKEGFPVVIFRPPTVYGPGERFNFLKLSQAIAKKRFWTIGRGDNLMSMCFVGNLVTAIVKSLSVKNIAGEVFLIDDGTPYSQKQVASEIAKAEGVKLSRLSIPLNLAYLAGVIFELSSKILPYEPPLTRRRIATLTSNFAYDTSKIKRVLGYKPHFSFTQAVKETIKSYRQDGLL